MSYAYFSKNGKVLPIDKAQIPLSNLEYSYGFGVYETIRVVQGKPCFLEQHSERLMRSAHIIDLAHPFDETFVHDSIAALTARIDAQAYNLKILLIGGPTTDKATLYILCLNPHFPDRKLYREGAICTIEHLERSFPGAKTLNMLPSYLAYRRARAAGAYDAVLVNRSGHITEGTRTNFFAMHGRTLLTPPAADCLEGVTRHNLIGQARAHGFQIQEQSIALDDVKNYDCIFLTSATAKLMPVRSMGTKQWTEPVSPALHELMRLYDTYIETYLSQPSVGVAT